MRRATASFLFVLLSGLPAQAQAILFRETFNVAPGTGQALQGGEPLAFPASWARENRDGIRYGNSGSSIFSALDVVAWMLFPDSYVGTPVDTVAVSTSWTDPAGGTVDDWMITPGIRTGSAAMALWKATVFDPGYPDGYEVWVSNTTQTAAGCLAGTRIYRVAATAVDSLQLQTYSAALPPAALNTTAYVCFRNHNTDLYLLAIDDVTVAGTLPTATEDDAALRGFDVRAFAQAGRLHVRLDMNAPLPVRVDVVNVLGQRVAVLHDGLYEGGVLALDRSLPAGTYYVRASTATGSKTVSVPLGR